MSGPPETFQNSNLSSPTLILELRGTKLMKLGHEGLLNTRNTFPKEDFPKSKYFPINLGLTQKPRVSR
jgi:hypothetical protein